MGDDFSGKSGDFQKAVLSYDRRSDTLFMHLHGRSRPALSMLIGSHRYLLVAPHSHEVVGFQIEDFLDQMVQAYPYLIFVLKVAQLRGITTDEVTKLSRRMLPSRFRLGYQIRMMFGGATSTKRTFAGQFADAGPWAIPPTVAWL